MRLPKLSWAEEIGLVECPYLKRWVLDFGIFSFRLHRWQESDDNRAFHDHPWWFITIVLWGSYTDASPNGRDLVQIGSIRFRSALHKHTVEVHKPGTWSFIITGPVVRRWGFWVNNKLHLRDRYFATSGHHPCNSGQRPVRRRPDGSYI